MAEKMEILGKFVVLIFLMISLGGCWWMADPEYFMRAGMHAVDFRDGNKLQGKYRIELPGAANQIELQGLLHSMESTCGEINNFILRISITRSDIIDNVIIDSDEIQVFFKDSLFSLNFIDTVDYLCSGKKNVYDMSFGGDTCKTISIIQHPFDSVNAKVKIYFGDALTIDNEVISVDTIFAYK